MPEPHPTPDPISHEGTAADVLRAGELGGAEQLLNALRASEERFRTVVENLSEGLMIFDADRNLIFQNAASLRIHGFEPDQRQLQKEAIPVTWKAWDETGRAIGFEEWPVSRVFRHEHFQDQILRVERVETGRVFYGSYNGSPILGPDGKLALGFITIRDITERIRARESLAKNEQRLRRFFDSEMMGALYWTMDGRITDANEKFLRMVGYSREEVVGGRVSWAEMTPPEYQRADEYALHELRTTGVDTAYEKEYIRKDGTRVPILIGAAMLDETRHEGLAFVLDITARKQAEQALRESERQFRALAESIPQLVWTADAEGAVDYVNQRWCSYTGQTQESARGSGWVAALHSEDRPKVVKAWRRAYSDGSPYEVEYRLRAKDESYRWHLARGTALKDSAGVIRRWFGTTTDIDDQKRTLEALIQSESLLKETRDALAKANADLEQRVQERTARLRDTVAELEHFSYTITHDLRAPLRAMQAFGEILREEYHDRLDETGADYLRRIIQASVRMDDLITDALSYAKAVQTELNLEPLDVGEILRGILESYPQFQAPRAVIELAERIPPVVANAAGFTQCASNLLSNAVKFVAPGTLPRIRIWAEPHGRMIRLWFEDNGIGVPPDQRERVFDMFQRLNRNYEGTGVGLALVKKVVGRMRGNVGVEPGPNGGSRFWLELERAAEGEAR